MEFQFRILRALLVFELDVSVKQVNVQFSLLKSCEIYDIMFTISTLHVLDTNTS